jgi:hypothetical protein
MSKRAKIKERNESFLRRSFELISLGVPYQKGELTFLQKTNNGELEVIKEGEKPLFISIRFPKNNFLDTSAMGPNWSGMTYIYTIENIENNHLQNMNIFNTELEFIGIGDKIYIAK